ncbi:hypothetical protein HN836_03795, partial [Candidatus Woesearchaeota archaeon]|nr:hypothetical protein [Candidatus Woesearchaeota archaeon]
EIAVRDETNVLFFKVPWKDVVSKNVEDFYFKTSYHPLDNEVEVVKEDKNSKRLINIAKEHYLFLMKNLKDYKEI